MADRTLSRAEEMYHAALARRPAEREAFLDEACQGDEALLAEVKDLLAFQADAKRLLGEPVAEAATQPLALTKGARLGHYEVAELIDAGGMGEVYRARDTKLQRDLALKVLPAAFSRDSERVARFEREARLLAALNHPHIEAIHGLEEFDGRHALALELVPGETLAERTARGPIPVSEALALARQMAEALEAAHEKGVVHRDVKPANVKVTPDGQVKLLDLGLAKALTAGAQEEPPGRNATADGTRSGLILGTVRYMSPEQARGEPLDERTDIWSFGAVLFEMLAGQRAFAGETTSEVLAGVLKDEPDWSALPPDSPPGITRLLRRCLHKHRRERFHSIADVRIDLEDLPSGAERASPGAAPASLGWLLRVWWTWAAVVAALLVGGLAQHWRRGTPPDLAERRVLRSQIELTAGRPLLGRTHSSSRTELAVSPDGSLLVWVSDRGTAQLTTPGADAALELRRLDTGEVRRLAGTEGASQPFFSPDGRWIGFFAREDEQWHLRKVSADGDLPVDLTDLPVWPRGGSWAADGRIYVGMHQLDEDAGGLAWIPEKGGPYRRLTRIDLAREVGHLLPHPLPDGHSLLFTVLPDSWGVRSRVEGLRLESGERKTIVEDAADGRYLPTGHLVFARRGVMMAAPFDPQRLELLATPVPVIPGVAQALNNGCDLCMSGASQLAVSETGLIVYAAGGIAEDPAFALVVVDEAGNVESLPGFDKPLLSPQLHLSPDGRKLAFVEQASSGLAWVFDLERRTHTPLSRSGMASAPVWSPDGKRIAMAWSEAGALGLWVLPADGRGEWERVAPGGMAPSWSPDARFLAFCWNGDILLYRFADRRVVPFVAEEGRQSHPEFSPDGRWLAYGSSETGRQEVYVTAFPGREQTLTVSDTQGRGPVWSRDGRRLYYLGEGNPATGRRRLMVVRVHPGPPLSLERPTALLHAPPTPQMIPMRYYEILPDGRFLFGTFVSREPGVRSPPITRLELIQNWFTELERLVPTKATSGGL